MVKPRRVFTFRLLEDLVYEARKQGINIPDLIEEAICKRLFKCPHCLSKVKQNEDWNGWWDKSMG